eukprot:TRINITY_DN944_c0_g1_i1.p1 TRINITY_DN944_c0_g1~~TRINITY_DN944_c0_g1_i1.p1  ORF type:complete len:696 (-),score=201.65 TRINITY_DN944_c0_g1_i1:101-2188(-)
MSSIPRNTYLYVSSSKQLDPDTYRNSLSNESLVVEINNASSSQLDRNMTSLMNDHATWREAWLSFNETKLEYLQSLPDSNFGENIKYHITQYYRWVVDIPPTPNPLFELDNVKASFERLAMGVVAAFSSLFLLYTIGLVMIEMGFVGIDFTERSVLKNILVIMVVSLLYYAVIHSLITGNQHAIIGFSNRVDNSDLDHNRWMMGFSWLLASVLTCFGALCERSRTSTYVVIAIVHSLFVFPFALYAIWSPEGLLRKIGVEDFSGAIVVHVCGGMWSLVGTLYVGPRWGVFGRKGGKEMVTRMSYSMPMVAAGVLMTWFAVSPQTPFLAWNASEGIEVSNASNFVAGMLSRPAMSRIIAGCFAIALTLVQKDNNVEGRHHHSKYLWSVRAAYVSLSASASVVTMPVSVFTACVGVVIHQRLRRFLIRIRVDDALHSISIDLACGIWSLLSVGLFKNTSISIVESDAIVGHSMSGLFYGGGLYVFLAQFAACISIVIYVGMIATITLQVLRRIPHGLRKHGVVDGKKQAIMRKKRTMRMKKSIQRGVLAARAREKLEAEIRAREVEKVESDESDPTLTSIGNGEEHKGAIGTDEDGTLMETYGSDDESSYSTYSTGSYSSESDWDSRSESGSDGSDDHDHDHDHGDDGYDESGQERISQRQMGSRHPVLGLTESERPTLDRRQSSKVVLFSYRRPVR